MTLVCIGASLILAVVITSALHRLSLMGILISLAIPKKIAVVAVARKLGVLLHGLWVTGEEYDPFYATKRKGAAQKKVA